MRYRFSFCYQWTTIFIHYRIHNVKLSIGGVRVSMLVLILEIVDSGQTIDSKIGIWCFSAKHAALRCKTGWLGSRIMCLSHFIECILFLSGYSWKIAHLALNDNLSLTQNAKKKCQKHRKKCFIATVYCQICIN
jgi:hypothetical protein